MSLANELLRAAEHNRRVVTDLAETCQEWIDSCGKWQAFATRLERRIADIHQHAILVSGVVPNDCPDREALVEKIQAIGADDA